MKIVLLGSSGQVGWALQRALAPLGDVAALDRAEADFSQPDSLRAVLDAHAPDIIVNAAAYTAVDRAESEPELARAVNTDSVAAIAAHAADNDCWLVHYSTDYVFDGLSDRPYQEDDATTPLSAYGRTKRDGEIAIAQSGAAHLVFRTSWVHGGHGANFIRTILRLAQERDRLEIVADQIGAPTGADLIADVTAHVLHMIVTGGAPVGGLYHLTAAGETNWCDYARLVVAEAASGPAAVRIVAADEANSILRASSSSSACSSPNGIFGRLVHHFIGLLRLKPAPREVAASLALRKE